MNNGAENAHGISITAQIGYAHARILKHMDWKPDIQIHAKNFMILKLRI